MKKANAKINPLRHRTKRDGSGCIVIRGASAAIESMETRLHLSATYYATAGSGSGGTGTISNPWTSLSSIGSGVTFHTGDVVSLSGTFTNQSLSLTSTDAGITLTSNTSSQAVISENTSWTSGNTAAISVTNVAGVTISDITLTGPGITANTTNDYGIWFDDSASSNYSGATVSGVTESGFAYAGLQIQGNGSYGFDNVLISNSTFSDNQVSGIVANGSSSPTTYSTYNLTITNCVASGNAGEDVHSGSPSNSFNGGIFLEGVNDGTVSHCQTIGNCYNSGGAVGTWAYNSNAIDFEYDESADTQYASQDPHWDADGFDFDHGVTNSIMQYDYSHGNYGQAYVIATYSGTTNDANNTIRYCVSDDDGGGVSLYSYQSGSTIANITGANIYDNTLIIGQGGPNDSSGSTVYDDPEQGLIVNGTNSTVAADITANFLNNIVVGITGSGSSANALVNCAGFTPSSSNLKFEGNDYWETAGGSSSFFVRWGTSATYTTFTGASSSDWTYASGEETISGSVIGLNTDPKLTNETVGDLSATSANAFRLQPSSPLLGAGQNLSGSPYNGAPYNISSAGPQDFFGDPLVTTGNHDIGADQASIATGELYFKSTGTFGQFDLWVNSSTPGSGTPTDIVSAWLPVTYLDNFTGGSETVAVDESGGSVFNGYGMQFNASSSYVSGNLLFLIGTPGSDTYAGSSSSLSFDGAPINFNNLGGEYVNPDGGTDSMSISSGGFVLAAGASGSGINLRQFSTLSIAAGSELYVQPPNGTHGDRQLLDVPNSSFFASGVLDLTSNDLLATNGVSNWSGLNGAVAGASITTSTTSLITSAGTAATKLGVVPNNGGSGTTALYSTFDGVSVSYSDVLIKWTFAGDANDSGYVDSTDSGLLTGGINDGKTGWYNGDFNYDGSVNSADQTIYNSAVSNEGTTHL